MRSRVARAHRPRPRLVDGAGASGAGALRVSRRPRRASSSRCSAIAAPRSLAGAVLVRAGSPRGGSAGSAARARSRAARRRRARRGTRTGPKPSRTRSKLVRPPARCAASIGQMPPPSAVRADDDLVRAHALEHRDPGRPRQAVDRQPQVSDRRLAPCSHRVRRLPRGGAATLSGGRRSPSSDLLGVKGTLQNEARSQRRLLGNGDRPAGPAAGRPGGRAARLRLRLGRRGVRLGRGDRARVARRRDEQDQARLGDLPDARPQPGDDRDDGRDDRRALGRADAASGSAPRARRSPRAGTASASPTSCSARASTSRSFARPWRASGSSTTARRSSCRCPTGPGKALKLMITPVQERIPIYLAAIGPKNTALAGEIADGWLPTFFSPEHVAGLPGAARGGGGPVRPLARGLRHRPERRPRTSPTTASWRAT